jgi:DNA polymerase-3 subunit epsilon
MDEELHPDSRGPSAPRVGRRGHAGRRVAEPTDDPSYSPPRLELLNWLAAGGPQPVQVVAARLLGASLPAGAAPTAESLVAALPRVLVDAGMASVVAPFWHDHPWLIVDIETTGDRPDPYGGITEIAAWRVRGGEVVDRFVSLVHPGRSIPHFIRQLTGIDDAMVAGAPRLADILPALRTFVGDDPWMAHNLRFDCGHLDAALAGHDLPPMPTGRFCTLRWARRALPGGRHGLAVLSERLRLGVTPLHRAEADVATTHRLALALFHQTPSAVRDFATLDRWLTGRRIRPPAGGV